MTGPLVAAVELGGTKINLAVGTGPDDLREHTRIVTADSQTNMASIVAYLRSQPGIEAVGIATFGPVCLDRTAPDWGVVAKSVKPGWTQVPVATMIADAVGLPVAIDTDVNGAAFGEYRWGALAGCGVGLYLTIGTGIGGGVVIDGVPLHGRIHPEMGHISVKRTSGDTFAGVCSRHGDCFEGLASGPAVLARLGKTLSETDPGDPGRALVIDTLGQGLAALMLTLSPHRIVVGGGVSQTPGFHQEVTERLVHWLADYMAIPDRFVVPPALGDRAGIAGAIALAQDLLDPSGKR